MTAFGVGLASVKNKMCQSFAQSYASASIATYKSYIDFL